MACIAQTHAFCVQVLLQTGEQTADEMVPIIITTMIMIITIFYLLFLICTSFLHIDSVVLSLVPLCPANERRHCDLLLEASPLKGRFGGVEP